MNINTVSGFRRFMRYGPYAWPGGYDMFAITDDGAILCYSCCDKERRNIVDAICNGYRDGWRVVAADASCNTDGGYFCDHCNAYFPNGEEYATDSDNDVE